MTGEDLIILASHAFGRYWQTPLARRLRVAPLTVLAWKKSRVPRYREAEIIAICRLAARENSKAIIRIARYLENEARKRAKAERARAEAGKRAPQTAFARTRRKALERYLAYRKKSDAAHLGHARKAIKARSV